MHDKWIDTNFDVRTDSNGIDPDGASPTLRKYHKILWSKPLPCGKIFDLVESPYGMYLIHQSELGQYWLSSDSITHSYRNWKRTKQIIEQVPPEEINYFDDLGYTIGGFLIFPCNKINGFQTINQERGTNKQINDRIDLTLECIRRFYQNESSPLAETLARYKDFFALFSDFKGYCEFFLLQDLVSQDFKKVEFFLPFEEFEFNPLPKSLEEYSEYRIKNIDFLRNRNKRISDLNQIYSDNKI